MNDQELDEFEQSLKVLHAVAREELGESIDVDKELLTFKKRAYAEAAEAASVKVPPERAALVATTDLLVRRLLTEDTQMPTYAYRDVIRVVEGRRPSLRKLVSVAGFCGLLSGMAVVLIVTATVENGFHDGWWLALVAASIAPLVLLGNIWLAWLLNKIDTFTVSWRICGYEVAITKSPKTRRSRRTRRLGKQPNRSTVSVKDQESASLEQKSSSSDRLCVPGAVSDVLVTRHGASQGSLMGCQEPV